MSNNAASSTPRPWLNRETILLALVGVVGLVGLLVLQVSRKGPGDRADQKSLLQSAAQAGETPAADQRTIQRISGNLLNINEDSEAGKPYFFRMTNHAQGAVYELDPGDGAGRIPFDEQGRASHTYRKAGNYTVTLYARFEGEEAVLQVIRHGVGQPIDVEKQPVNKEKQKVILDF